MSESMDRIVAHPGHVDGLKLGLGLCICYTLCVACLRGWIRWRNYGVDDLIVLFSTILALASFGCSYASASNGLGRPITDLNLDQPTVEKFNGDALAGNITWIISLCLSKIAVVAMLLRTTPTVAHRRVQYGIGALIVAQCIASIVLLTADCSLRNELSWLIHANSPECPQKLMRWQIITALDVTTETALLFLPVQLVWSLQMSARNKFIVILAFWLRLPTILFSILRYNKTQELTTTPDISPTAAIVVIWQAVQLSYALASVTITALKRFTESLNTGFGHGELMRVHGTSQAYKMSDRSATLKNTNASHSSTSRSKEFEVNFTSISSPQSNFTPRKQSLSAQNEHMMLRPENLRNTAIVSSPPKDAAMENRSIDSGGSDDNIIRQQVQYSVHYDEAPLVRKDYR